MGELTKLPVLALRDLVLFPGVSTAIGVGRERTIAAVQAALERDDRCLFAVLQQVDSTDIDATELHAIGTVVRIVQVNRSGNAMQLLVQGASRASAVRYYDEDAYVAATVVAAEDILPPDPRNAAVVALEREVRERALELTSKAGMPEALVRRALDSVEGLGPLADLVTSYLDIKAAEKQELLQCLSVEDRLRRVLVHVERWMEVRGAQETIQARVQEELGERQREGLLREQMKAIQSELGEGDARDEILELSERIEKLDLPESAEKEIHRELHRLESLSPESMEAQVLRSYLETVSELPWNIRSEERLDVQAAKEILDREHYGLPEVKDRVLEHLAVLQVKKQRAEESQADETDSDEPVGRRQSPILLFAGPPGVGKTSIAKSIAHATGREYVRVSLGGARDESDIRGHRRTYVGAMPGRIIQGLRQAGTQNPVFLLDEIDKLGMSYQGDPASALLEVLDPAQNDTFIDHYLGVPFDLSDVLFVATANYLQHLPAPLLDRMEIVEFEGYTEDEKREIAKRYLVPRQIRDAGLREDEVTMEDSAIEHVISHYTREAGVRQLEKKIGTIARKVTRNLADGGEPPFVVEVDDVRRDLGRPHARPERAFQVDRVGVATGMFYTPAGGDILFVEATTMPGHGHLQLTGQLGDVMQESARAAWSYARAKAPELLIDGDAFGHRDVHVHVPAGSIPKDGPSAGVTVATALVSALSGVPTRHDVAMTGEITLTGQVLPIGGVKEKVLGAVRAGIREFILPRENGEDLEDLTDEIRSQIKVHLVDQLDEVLELALRGGVFRSVVWTGSS